MSQYPQYPQYPSHSYPSQPMYGLPDPQADLLRPAKRASILMFLISGLCLTCGLCFGISSFVPMDQLDEAQREQIQSMEEQLGGWAFPAVMRASAVIIAGMGVALLVLALLVRRGGMGSVILTLIIVGGMGLLLLIGLVNDLILTMQNPAGIISVCIVAMPLALVTLLFVWLIQAARNAPRLAELRSAQQSAYWQSNQHRQQYGSGYWQQQQPPPPPPPPAG